MKRVSVFAPAKINLTLHITGQREDGFHELDSLVVFAPVGDALFVSEANTLSLTVEGPEAAGVPADMGNIALKAAELMRGTRSAALTLTKHLPVASGIGGGSADAQRPTSPLGDMRICWNVSSGSAPCARGGSERSCPS